MVWLMRGVLASLLLLALGLGLLWGYASRAQAPRSGELSVRGPLSRLSIERDAHGLPTVRAASQDDAWFGLGFAHAQDRLWQLELHRRTGAGRLAEVFGPPAVEADRFLRALGVRRAAAEQWAKTDPLSRRALEAYAAGINAYLNEHLKARPPEFLLLGVRPEPWHPIDSLAWSIMMAWDLGGNWRSELLRLRLALFMPVERIDELLPPYPGERAPRTRDYAELFRRLQLGRAEDTPAGPQAATPDRPAGADAWLARVLGGGEGLGSNNWAVNGPRSATGRPLLANDPHLKLGSPPLWYLARLEAPGLRVAGATIPGLPVVVVGQNEHLAWTFTNTNPDVQDLYLERLDPERPDRYLSADDPPRWAHFETFPETIRVKDAPDVQMLARRSRHGPILSDGPATLTAGLGGLQLPRAGLPGYALALRWTALDPDTGTLAAGLGYNRARSIEEFSAAAAAHVAPMQNAVVGDRRRIAFLAVGRVPVRKTVNDLRGRAPAPGWDPRYDWDGFLDPALNPREIAPERHWLATANQRIHAPAYPHALGSDWALPLRQQRIETLLAARPVHDLDSFAAMQRDLHSGLAEAFLPALRAAPAPDHPLAPAARSLLAGFDGRMDPEQPAPLIFWAWLRHLGRGILADQLGPELYERELVHRSFHDALLGILARQDAGWCDDIRTPQAEDCPAQVQAALGRALDELQTLQGPDPTRWRWGDAHLARAEHRPFSRVRLLRPWFELQAPVGGDGSSLFATRVWLSAAPAELQPYQSEHAGGLRLLLDVADPRRSRALLFGGPSGLFFSRAYREGLPAWQDGGEALPLWPPEEPGRMLRLLPR